jgi:hypothetical protein
MIFFPTYPDYKIQYDLSISELSERKLKIFLSICLTDIYNLMQLIILKYL